VRAALVDGAVGAITAPNGRLTGALRLTFAGDAIVAVEIITDPARLERLEIAVLDPPLLSPTSERSMPS
jgi:RNA polymerase sigma-70 factor (ECF subfamily)